jgi:hypothetical protein
VAVVPDGLPVEEVEPLPEVVLELPVPEVEVPEPELDVPPVPVPEPLAPELVPFVVPVVDPVLPGLVVPVDPDDEPSDDGEPLVELPVSPLWGLDPLEDVDGSVPVDGVPVPEGSEPPAKVAVTDDPGSVRPAEELSEELELAGVEVIVEPRPGRGARGGLPVAACAADLAFACVTSAVPAAVAAAACALEIWEGSRPPCCGSSASALRVIAGRAWAGCDGGPEIATAPLAVATAAASSVAT